MFTMELHDPGITGSILPILGCNLGDIHGMPHSNFAFGAVDEIKNGNKKIIVHINRKQNICI
jgi:hypothetical protein